MCWRRSTTLSREGKWKLTAKEQSGSQWVEKIKRKKHLGKRVLMELTGFLLNEAKWPHSFKGLERDEGDMRVGFTKQDFLLTSVRNTQLGQETDLV